MGNHNNYPMLFLQNSANKILEEKMSSISLERYWLVNQPTLALEHKKAYDLNLLLFPITIRTDQGLVQAQRYPQIISHQIIFQATLPMNMRTTSKCRISHLDPTENLVHFCTHKIQGPCTTKNETKWVCQTKTKL